MVEGVFMKKYTSRYLELIKGNKIGSGSEKTCYLSNQNKDHCLKVSSLNHCVQMMREIEYFEFMQKKWNNILFCSWLLWLICDFR